MGGFSLFAARKQFPIGELGKRNGLQNRIQGVRLLPPVLGAAYSARTLITEDFSQSSSPSPKEAARTSAGGGVHSSPPHPCSSGGQSAALRMRRSQVRVLAGVQVGVSEGDTPVDGCEGHWRPRLIWDQESPRSTRGRPTEQYDKEDWPSQVRQPSRKRWSA